MEIATRRREQEVWQACDDLWASHGDLKILTGDAIRERLLALGKSRGSPNEIYKYRKSWSTSRGISHEAASILNSEGDDPITRAVRLVHEKLQAEAHEQMDIYKNEMNTQVEEKEAQLRKAKEDLVLTMEEFSKAQNENGLLKKKLAQNAEQLDAEVQVRMALERELAAIKKDFKQALDTHNHILSETKDQHQQLIHELKSLFTKQEAALLQRLEKVEQEKKELGHHFSEQLNEHRTKEYNLNIMIENLNNKVEEHKVKILLQSKTLEEGNVNLRQAINEVQTLRASLQTLLIDCAKFKADLALKERGQKRLALDLKKSEISVARLRAALAHQEMRCR